MRRLQTGSEVSCNVRGVEFSAVVTGRPAGGWLPIVPKSRRISHRRVRPRQVTDLLASPKRSGQLAMGVKPLEDRSSAKGGSDDG